MKGLLTRANYIRRDSRLFDGVMFAWAIAIGLILADRVASTGLVFAYSADDQLMLPLCEACKLLNTNEWGDWLIWILNGCASC